MFNLKRVTAPTTKIIFDNDFEQINYQFNLPLLIDRKGNVVLGNSLREQYKDKANADVVVMSVDEYALNVFKQIELAVISENSSDRYKAIETEFKRFLKRFNKDIEVLSLFSDDELKQKGLVTDENFIMPPPYNFTKNSNKDNDEIDEADLFNLLGGLE